MCSPKTNQLNCKMDSSGTDTCEICHAEFNEATTPGEFCYTCCRCEQHVCTMCSDNDLRDSSRVIRDECWTDLDEEYEPSPANA